MVAVDRNDDAVVRVLGVVILGVVLVSEARVIVDGPVVGVVVATLPRCVVGASLVDWTLDVFWVVVVTVAIFLVVTARGVVACGVLDDGFTVLAPFVVLVFLAALLECDTFDAATAAVSGLPLLTDVASGVSELLLSPALCLEFESFSLEPFLFGFFMFLTTFPVDLTGVRFVFIGMVTIGFSLGASLVAEVFADGAVVAVVDDGLVRANGVS